MTFVGRFVWLAVLLAQFIGCGGRSREVWKRDKNDASQAGVNSGRRGPKNVRLQPTARFAESYQAPGISQKNVESFFLPTISVLSEVADSTNRSRPWFDARLSRAATDWAELAALDIPIPYEAIEFSLQHHGIVEPSPLLIIVKGGDPTSIAEELRPSLEESFAKSRFSRVGLGRAGTNNNLVTVLALQNSSIELRPMSKVFDSGDPIRFRGRVLSPYRDPHVFVTRRNGKVEEIKVEARADGFFEAVARCGAAKGKIQVEVTARDRGGPTVLANYPIWCGNRPPRGRSISLLNDAEDAVRTRSDAENLMTKLVNDERVRAGLPKLAVNSRLASVSRRYSEEMARTGIVAHISQLSGAPFERVKAGGVGATAVLENLSKSGGILEAHKGLMNSPGHRANILSTEVNQIGIGVAQVEADVGPPAVYVTQLFIQVPRAVKPQQMRKKVQSQIEKQSRLLLNEVLHSTAQLAAERLADGMPVKAASKEASREISARRAPFRKVTTLVTTILDENYPVPNTVKDSSYSHYGIGVAVAPATSKDSIPSVFVVLLLGA